MTSVVAGVAFAGMFDDAAIFPPGNAPLPEAVTAHRGYRGGELAPLVGPFVCSLARLGELDGLLDAPLEVAAVIPPGRFSLPPLRHVQVMAVERHADAVGTTPAVTTYVELPTLPATAAQLAGMARVKLRTGGPDAAAFPSEPALAAAIRAAVDAGTAFKCTAGLHSAARHTSPEGFEQHGFLNVLLGTCAARTGGEVAATLAERDGAALAARVRAMPEPEIVRTRQVFCSFGTCSIAEPVAALRDLGLLG